MSRPVVEWILLASAVALVALLVAVDLRAARQARMDQQRARLEHQARLVQRMLSMRIDGTSNALALLLQDVRTVRAHPDGLARLNERMEAVAASTAGVRSILLVDREGRSIASNRKELVGIDFREGERYRIISTRPDASLLYISPPFMSPLKKWVLSLGRANLDARGAFDGYVLAIIDPDYFNLLLDSTRYAPDMMVALVHSGGKVIFRVPDPGGAVGTDLSAKPDSAFALHERSGADRSVWTMPAASTGVESLLVLQDVRPSASPADGSLVAVFGRETQAILAPWWQQVRDRVALLAVVAVASAGGLVVVQRRRAATERSQSERDAERRAQEEARAALQARLAQSQKLESVGRLAGGVAHDFNNLLTVILAYADGALAEARSGKVPDPEGLEDVREAAERAATLTRQLLAFARKQIVSPVVLDLNEHVAASERLLRRLLGEDVRVEETLERGLWPVRCDPGLLGQVILNLAVNARDAMPGGGTLRFATGNVTLEEGDAPPAPGMEPGEYVRLAVGDTGTGMGPEVLEHLFEPFFTTKAAGKGTGLGLATVYGIVRQTGAHMRVRSTPGQGSTFEIFFPRSAEGLPAPSAARAARGNGSETVLVVEDDDAVRGAVAEALRAGGYRVLAAATAAEALDLAERETGGVDLLLTDLVLPGEAGVDVARIFTARFPAARVLYMSGHGDAVLDAPGRRDAPVAFLPKPFTPEVLRARVREVLDGVRPALAT